MTEKELKKLGRKELLEIIYEMKKRELALQAELDEANAKLADREYKVSKVGSIAEAALAVNGVFEAAQAAADDYLRVLARSQVLADKIVAEAKEERERIIAEAQREATERVRLVEEKRRNMLADANRAEQERWSKFNQDLESLLMAETKK